MSKLLGRNIYSLPVQIILSFFVLILITAAAIGVPAIAIIQDQLERQAWVLVDQGRTTTLAVYAEMQSELDNLAILTSQRPTLLALIEQDNQAELQSYLQTFLNGTNLDFVMMCEPDGRLFAKAGSDLLDDLCDSSISSGLFIDSTDSLAIVSLVGIQPVQTSRNQGMKVIVGEILDTESMLELRNQTGLEQTLLVGDQFVATSFVEGQRAWEEWLRFERKVGSRSSLSSQSTSTIGGDPYFSDRYSLDNNLQSIVSLPVVDIATAQRQLSIGLGAGFVFVVILGSALAIYLTRRISRPLVQLERAAAALQKGDLETPVSVETKVSEVAQVAYALEDARSVLHYTLAELRQEKAWASHLLESVVEGIVTLDKQGRITFFSHGAERISGCNQDQVIGRSCDEIFRPVEDNGSFSEQLPPPGKQQNVYVEFPSGRQAVLAITGAQLAPPQAGKARVALVLRDVSEEEAIHRLIGEYMGNITHEFRTPLAALAASVELLLDQLPDLSQGELETLLNSVRLGVLSLQTLIDNLLEGASIETGHFQVYLRKSDLENIIQEVVRLMQPLVDKYQLELSLIYPDKIPPVSADPRRTSQILINLLANAIKHSPKGSQVSIKVIPGDEDVRIEVADRGPGISPKRRVGLFRRQVYPDMSNSEIEHGAGLGLPVVKAIVDAQGGRVGVDDHPNGGAIFWFTLNTVSDEQIKQEQDR